VYLDLYFLVNLWMDLLILDLTQQLLKLPGSKKRLLAAAVTGAGTACVLAAAGWYIWWQRWLCGIPCAACMTGIAYGRASAAEEGRPPVRYDRPWLAISPHPLSSSHRYEMLLHIEEW
jgi:hypothetical protein